MAKPQRTKFDRLDHAILLGMVRGEEPFEVGQRLGLSKSTLAWRFLSMRRLQECRTSWQLIAHYMVFLQDVATEGFIEDIEGFTTPSEQKRMTATA